MTIIFVLITSAISILAFSKTELFSKLQFNPYQVYYKKEWYRLLTHGFLHADWMHLIINMLVLYSFGTAIESYFALLADAGMIQFPDIFFAAFYLVAIVLSSLLTLIKHKDNYYYNSVGASGAVSAVVFMHIFFAPVQKIYFYAILPIPGILFGVFYLIYSQYMSRKNKDNINHDAHFVGAVFGFVLPIFIDFQLLQHFINQLVNF